MFDREWWSVLWPDPEGVLLKLEVPAGGDNSEAQFPRRTHAGSPVSEKITLLGSSCIEAPGQPHYRHEAPINNP
jgi:hypothetical protein